MNKCEQLLIVDFTLNNKFYKTSGNHGGVAQLVRAQDS